MSIADLLELQLSLRRAEIRVRIRINVLSSDLEGSGLAAKEAAEDAWLELKRAAEAIHHAIERAEGSRSAGKVVSLADVRGRKGGGGR